LTKSSTRFPKSNRDAAPSRGGRERGGRARGRGRGARRG